MTDHARIATPHLHHRAPPPRRCHEEPPWHNRWPPAEFDRPESRCARRPIRVFCPSVPGSTTSPVRRCTFLRNPPIDLLIDNKTIFAVYEVAHEFLVPEPFGQDTWARAAARAASCPGFTGIQMSALAPVAESRGSITTISARSITDPQICE